MIAPNTSHPQLKPVLSTLFEPDLLHEQNDPSELSLRQFGKDGEFAKTVTCRPGEVCVLKAGPKHGLWCFREALLGRAEEAQVELRLGSSELHPSEIAVIRAGEEVWKGKTVLDVLERFGCKREVALKLLSEFGLAETAEIAPALLEGDQLRRFVLISSFFKKTRVLVYDNPFAGLEEPWISKFSVAIATLAECGNRIVVVSGMRQIPAVWKSAPGVHVEQKRGKLSQATTLITSRADLLKKEDSIRTMIQGSRKKFDSAELIITRPQEIYPSPGSSISEDSLCLETIENPHVERDFDSQEIEDLDETVQQNAQPRKSRRKRTLTGSYKVHRGVWHVRLRYELRERLREFYYLLVGPPVNESLPPEVRRRSQRERSLRTFFVLATLLLIISGEIWFIFG